MRLLRRGVVVIVTVCVVVVVMQRVEGVFEKRIDMRIVMRKRRFHHQSRRRRRFQRMALFATHCGGRGEVSVVISQGQRGMMLQRGEMLLLLKVLGVKRTGESRLKRRGQGFPVGLADFGRSRRPDSAGKISGAVAVGREKRRGEVDGVVGGGGGGG